MAPEPVDYFASARATARALRFDPMRQARLEGLIIALSSRGWDTGDNRIPLYLGPLLNSPESRSGALLPDIQADAPRSGDGGTLLSAAKKEHWTAKKIVGAALAAMLVVLITIAITQSYLLGPGNTMGNGIDLGPTIVPTPLPTPAATDFASLYLLNATVLGCIAALAALTTVIIIARPLLLRWWEKRRMRQLRRDPLPDRSALVGVATRLGRARLFSEPALTVALRKLRRHRAAPSAMIDVRRSIRATILNGKIPTLRFARRRLSPDYLLLSERERPHDHLADVATAWRERLNEARIACEHYEFFGDPHTLRQVADSVGRAPVSPGRERMDSVLARHDGADLVVMIESFDALTSADGNPQWLARAGLRVKPHLMNPREPRFWSQLETRLDNLGLPAFSASASGTLELADRIDRAIDDPDANEAPPRTPGQADLAAFLAVHRTLVLSPDRPTDEQIATIIDTLQRWLDADAFDWLRALAAMPMINGGFTFFAGCVLNDSTIVTHDRYLALARLPWLRAAYMPDWFRLALLETLSPAALTRAGATAAAFLLPPDGIGERHLLELRRHADHPAALKRLAKRLENSGNTGFDDRLLIEILKGSPPDKLGVLIDRDIAAADKAQRRRHTVLLIAFGTVSIIGLLSLQPSSWQDDGIISAGKSTEPVDHSSGPPSPLATPLPSPLPSPLPRAEPSQIPQALSPPRPEPSASPVPTPTASPVITPTPCKEATGAETMNRFIVFFDWDKSDITPQAASILDLVVDNYRCGYNLRLAAHTDRTESQTYNLSLSQREADSVRAYLVSKGLPESAISTEAFGESQPVVPTADGVRELQNRRVEITFGPGSGT